ncbi:hypothetical protein AB0L13_44305 [Saccharopolyspora shandongensis]|nr:hypothetical protein [Saccharopolyspora shandongensis]
MTGTSVEQWESDCAAASRCSPEQGFPARRNEFRLPPAAGSCQIGPIG